MNIYELHDFISDISKELPEEESRKLMEIRDSLDELGPSDWNKKLADFADELILRDIGNEDKLTLLKEEVENSGPLELSITKIFVFLAGAFSVIVFVSNVWPG